MHIDFLSITYDFFQSFLNKRKQSSQVNVSNKFSACEDIHNGVPQGSVLNPLLFNISLMTLAPCVTTLMIILYMLIAEISTKFKNIWKKILKY